MEAPIHKMMIFQERPGHGEGHPAGVFHEGEGEDSVKKEAKNREILRTIHRTILPDLTMLPYILSLYI